MFNITKYKLRVWWWQRGHWHRPAYRKVLYNELDFGKVSIVWGQFIPCTTFVVTYRCMPASRN